MSSPRSNETKARDDARSKGGTNESAPEDSSRGNNSYLYTVAASLLLILKPPRTFLTIIAKTPGGERPNQVERRDHSIGHFGWTFSPGRLVVDTT